MKTPPNFINQNTQCSQRLAKTFRLKKKQKTHTHKKWWGGGEQALHFSLHTSCELHSIQWVLHSCASPQQSRNSSLSEEPHSECTACSIFFPLSFTELSASQTFFFWLSLPFISKVLQSITVAFCQYENDWKFKKNSSGCYFCPTSIICTKHHIFKAR